MNIRRKRTRTAMLATLLTVCTVTGTGTALAESPTAAYKMAVNKDTIAARKILKGKYTEAISTTSGKVRTGFYDLTNLCVAYTMSEDYGSAAEVCEQAVTTSKRTGKRRDIALALSNRGVLYALKGNGSQAGTDFEAASSLASGISEPKHNLARLKLQNPS